jgi:hypothetical protein
MRKIIWIYGPPASGKSLTAKAFIETITGLKNSSHHTVSGTTINAKTAKSLRTNRDKIAVFDEGIKPRHLQFALNLIDEGYLVIVLSQEKPNQDIYSTIKWVHVLKAEFDQNDLPGRGKGNHYSIN